MARCSRNSSSISSSSRDLRSVARTRESSTRSMGLVLTPQPQHPANHAGDALPTLSLPSQLFPASLRDRVELRLAVAFRGAPLRRNPALLHQAQQRVVDGAFVQPQSIVANLLEATRDSISVQRPERVEGLEHHQVQRALQHLRAVLCHGHRCNVARFLCYGHRAAAALTPTIALTSRASSSFLNVPFFWRITFTRVLENAGPGAESASEVWRASRTRNRSRRARASRGAS